MLVYQSKWLKAKGELVQTEHGNKLDFTSGIFTSNLGHDNHAVKIAIMDQLNKGFTNTYRHPTEIRERYIERLKEYTGALEVFLFSTGMEACEAAYRMMRFYCDRMESRLTLLPDQFHGKSKSLLVDPHWFIYADEQIASADKATCGILMEPYRPYDARFYPDDFIMQIFDGFKVVCMDEVQAGFFRTGKMFGFQHYGSNYPEIAVVGKAIGNGFPLSAVLVFNSDFAKFVAGIRVKFTSTYAGNPLACAAGLATLNQFAEMNMPLGWMDDFRSELPDQVQGKGFCYALEVGKQHEENFVDECFYAGVMVVPTGKGWIKIAPPVNTRRHFLVNGAKVISRVYNAHKWEEAGNVQVHS